MTRAEALALVRGHLEVALAAERRPCATCCLAIFPRLHRDGADLWRPGLVWSQAMRSWTDAIDAWEAAGSPAEGKPAKPPPSAWYEPCPVCRGTGFADTARPLHEALAVLEAT